MPLKDKQDQLGEKGGGKLCIALQEGVIRTSRTKRVIAHSWVDGRR